MLAIWQQSSGMRFAMLWSNLPTEAEEQVRELWVVLCCDALFVVVVQFKSEESLTIILLSDCMFFFLKFRSYSHLQGRIILVVENIFKKHHKMPFSWGCWLGHLGPNHQLGQESWRVIQRSMFIAWGFEVHIEGGLERPFHLWIPLNQPTRISKHAIPMAWEFSTFAQVLVQLASTLAAADAGESDFYRRVLAAVTAPKTEGPKLGMSEESTEEPVVGCGACDDPIHLGPAGLNWGSCPVFWDLVGMLRIELHVKKTKKVRWSYHQAHIQFHNVS